MDVDATQLIGQLGFRIDRVGISLRKELDDLRADVRALREEVSVARHDVRVLAEAVTDLIAASISPDEPVPFQEVRDGHD